MRTAVAVAGMVLAIAGFLLFDYLAPGALVANDPEARARDRALATTARIRAAEARSDKVRGVYMTSAVANDTWNAAAKLRSDILKLIDTTELDAVVIDVKETDGGTVITERLTALIDKLHERNTWVIARQAVFKDSGQEQAHPGWYLTRKNARRPDQQTGGQGSIWRDNRGGSWLDPAAPEVWAYQLAVAKTASDAGFDEIQFDYIRFPSDGDVQSIIYPVYNAKRPKYEVLGEFFAYLSGELERHRPELILSADLFGYVALQEQDLGIGQRLEDIGSKFDYISLMVYPSHYYAGFQVAADPARGLPAIHYPYHSANSADVAANQPYDVVYRSLLMAQDILAGRATTAPDATTAAATSTPPTAHKTAKLRPWLQDFDLAVDSARGIKYDAAKVRAQIDAAEAAGASGWLLWNPSNVYTKEALKVEVETKR